MPSFTYRALDRSGEEITGVVDAADRSAALRDLVARGTSVMDLREGTRRVSQTFAAGGEGIRRIRPKQVAIMTRQLAISLEAGLPLMTALDVMGQQLDHAPSRHLLDALKGRVQTGSSLSDALEEHPRVFSQLYVRLVRVGETGGVLESVLAQLADMMDRQVEMRERIKTASIYPAILLLVGLVSVVIIVAEIVPRIISSIGVETVLLPWPTRVLMGCSGVFQEYWAVMLIAAAGGWLTWRQLVLRGPGRPWWDGVKLKVPILGPLIRQLEAGRFSRSLGILARGGVTVTEALAVVHETIQNTLMRNAVYELAESIKAGQSVARPLQKSGLFPPLLVQMVRVGENTGRLDEMLLRSADVHETEARVTLDRLVSVFPVLMILVLACVIGFVVAALVLAVVEFQTTGFGALSG